MTTPILIDCDPGHDDAIALLLALASPELELVGVTTVGGNARLVHTTANAIRVLELVGRGDVPVAAGADRPLVRPPFTPSDVHGATGLDGPELPPPVARPVAATAVELMAGRVRAAAAPLTLVPTGPLTNVALFLAAHPELAARLERIVLMGGAIGEGNLTPAAEFNIWADPDAAQRVLSSGVDVTMVGIDVTHQALIDAATTEELRACGRRGRVVAELIDFFMRSHGDMPGAPVHDAVAVAHVVWPDLLRTERCNIEVECGSDLCRGRTEVDRFHRTGREPNAHAAVGIDGPLLVRRLVERIASLG